MILFENIEFILQKNVFVFGLFFFYFGCILGSFFNVVVLRYPLMMNNEDLQSIKNWFNEKKYTIPKEIDTEVPSINLSYPSSHCFTCKEKLKWYHNIPLFSYIFLKGKCGYCKTKFSCQYPIVEFITGVILCASFNYFIGKGLEIFLIGSTILLILFVVSMIDIKSFLIPDYPIYFILWSSLILNSVFNLSIYTITIQDAIVGATLGYLLPFLVAYIGKMIKGTDVMGNGDFKLLASIGAILGTKGVIFTFFYAPFIGIAFWLFLKLYKNNGNMIPYGPSLILAGITYFLCGEDILRVII